MIPLLFSILLSILQLKDQLPQADTGDYIVTQQGKSTTLWNIKEQHGDLVVIEEIGLPPSHILNQYQSFPQYLDLHAPCHTHWLQYAISKSRGKLLGIYSETQQTYLASPKTDRFLTTLLNLSFSPTSSSWTPPFFFEGEQIHHLNFQAYVSRWPKDGSELSGKKIHIFIPDSPLYPNYMPAWMEIQAGMSQIKIRARNSGKNLSTPSPSRFQTDTPPHTIEETVSH